MTETNLTTLRSMAQVAVAPANSVEIEIPDGDHPIRLQVFFALDFTQAFGRWQNITTCGVRFLHREVTKTGKVHYHASPKTYWGNTIQNPHDMNDKRRGRQVAFRRAFATLVKDELEVSDPDMIVALYGDARRAMFAAGAW